MSGAPLVDKGHTLVICEKPDAARRVADALSGGSGRMTRVDGAMVFSFSREGEDFVVCSAQGHVYGVSDPLGERTVYPVFDVEWYPLDFGATAPKLISVARKLAAGATRFVNACDFDVEGEAIGFNVLRYACGGAEGRALRAKFSTLTQEDLKKAFDDMKPQAGQGLARAGRARHVIDFVWGVNLSRALSQSPLGSGHMYRTVSIGRVQGPTLGFLVQREREIREFVPIPYWRVSGIFEKGGKRILADYSEEKVMVKSMAEEVRRDCLGREAVAANVTKSSVRVSPPPAFNIGDLQKEAYRAFGFTPSTTLRIAERLYLGAMISYPRTGSQKLPASIDYRGIMQGLVVMPGYSDLIAKILKTELHPVQGIKFDPAHPAIHPTGERPRRRLDGSEISVLDLVIRRFLAAFGSPALREVVEVTLMSESHSFRAAGSKDVFPGWMKYYGKYARYKNDELPAVSEGDKLNVVDVSVEEKFEQRPPRYNQSTLLEQMEKEGIGTKATRADIITTLLGRGYVAGERMEATDLGLSVVEVMEKYAPSIVSTKLTRHIEESLEAVEAGEGEAEVLRETIRSVSEQLAELGANEEVVGREIDSAQMITLAKTEALGECPVCKTGHLRIVRSRTTKKRFVGCSNYSQGCRASAPLPLQGRIRPAMKACESCSWPIIYVVTRRRPWRLCVNPNCSGKKRP